MSAPPPLPPAASAAVHGVRQGQGTLLVLLGGERRGRSQVVEGLAREARAYGWETLYLRAHPLDEEVPFGALQPWLSRWLASHTEAPTEARDRISASFSMALAGLLPERSTNAPGAAERAPTPPSPALSTAEPAALTPAEVRTGMLEVVEGRTSRRPTLVVLEDAEFLDASSWAWLAFLRSRLGKLPLLVALASEPEPAVVQEWRKDPVKEGLVVCPILEEPTARSAGESWLGRLRTLPPRSHAALAASVLAGPDASLEVLRQVLACGAPELELSLSPLVDGGLLGRREERLETLEPRLFPDLAGTLPRTQAVPIHRELARALEQREPHPRGALLFRISHHWAEAGEVSRGVVTLLESAQEAERWGAPELAVTALRRAIVLAQTDPTARGREAEERAYASLGECRARAGDAAGAAEAFRRATKLAQERGSRVVQWARYIPGLADAEIRLGKDPEEELRSVLAQVQGRSPELESAMHRSLSRVYLQRGRPDLATESAERACAIAEKLNDPPLRARSHLIAANAYLFSTEDPERARAHLRRGLEERSRLEGTPAEELVASLTGALALLEMSEGNVGEAVRAGEESVTAARRIGSRTTLLTSIGNMAEYALAAGQVARASELIQELRWSCERLGIEETDVPLLQLLLVEGILASKEGRLDDGRRCMERLVTTSERGGIRFFLGQALVQLSALALAQGDLDAARRFVRRIDKEGVRRSLLGEPRRTLVQVEAQLFGESSRSPPAPARP